MLSGRFFGSGVLEDELLYWFDPLHSSRFTTLCLRQLCRCEVSILLVELIAIASGVLASKSTFRSSTSGVSVISIVAGDSTDGVDVSVMSAFGSNNS